MKNTIFMLLLLSFISVRTTGQSIIGEWEGTQQIKCQDTIPDSSRSMDPILESFIKSDMRSFEVSVSFDDKKIIKVSLLTSDRSKRVTAAKFNYSANSTNIIVLERKSKKPVNIYSIETLTNDSLVYSAVVNKCVKFMLLRKK